MNNLPNDNPPAEVSVDKRPQYVWRVVWIFTLGIYLVVVNLFIYNDRLSAVEGLIYLPSLLVLGLSFITFVIPIFISGLRSKWRRRLLVGVPALSLSLILYLVWYMYNCTAKFCTLGIKETIGVLIISTIIFFGVYVLRGLLLKWDKKIVLFIIKIGLAVLLGAMLFLIYSIYLDYSFSRLKNGDNMDSVKAARLCNIPMLSFVKERGCWREVVEKFPSIDVCGLVEDNETQKKRCASYRDTLLKKE